MISVYQYNSWPLGKLPPEFQRPELQKIKELGYEWQDPRDVIDIFESKVAKFAGSKYAITVDCCSHATFLCLKYLQAIGELPQRLRGDHPQTNICLDTNANKTRRFES